MSLFELCTTIASSTARSSAEAVDIAAATARRTSDACILAFPLPLCARTSKPATWARYRTDASRIQGRSNTSAGVAHCGEVVAGPDQPSSPTVRTSACRAPSPYPRRDPCGSGCPTTRPRHLIRAAEVTDAGDGVSTQASPSAPRCEALARFRGSRRPPKPSRCRIAHNRRTRKSLKESREAVSNRGRGFRSRGERPPTKGAPKPQEMIRDAVPVFRDRR